MEKKAQKESSDTPARKKYEILESAGLQVQRKRRMKLVPVLAKKGIQPQARQARISHLESEQDGYIPISQMGKLRLQTAVTWLEGRSRRSKSADLQSGARVERAEGRLQPGEATKAMKHGLWDLISPTRD